MNNTKKFLTLSALLAVSITAGWAQTAGAMPAPDASMFQPLIDALLGKYGWMVTVVAILGTLRVVFKPVMLVIEAVVKNSASTDDDKKLADFEAGPIYRWLVWALDFVASIKSPTATTTNPVIKS